MWLNKSMDNEKWVLPMFRNGYGHDSEYYWEDAIIRVKQIYSDNTNPRYNAGDVIDTVCENGCVKKLKIRWNDGSETFIDKNSDIDIYTESETHDDVCEKWASDIFNLLHKNKIHLNTTNKKFTDKFKKIIFNLS